MCIPTTLDANAETIPTRMIRNAMQTTKITAMAFIILFLYFVFFEHHLFSGLNEIFYLRSIPI